jgi:hypothetical protein
VVCFYAVGCGGSLHRSFKEPQPEGVKSLSAIPAKLHGTYQIEKNGTPSGNMVVEANGYRIEKDEYDQAPEVFC